MEFLFSWFILWTNLSYISVLGSSDCIKTFWEWGKEGLRIGVGDGTGKEIVSCNGLEWPNPSSNNIFSSCFFLFHNFVLAISLFSSFFFRTFHFRFLSWSYLFMESWYLIQFPFSFIHSLEFSVVHSVSSFQASNKWCWNDQSWQTNPLQCSLLFPSMWNKSPLAIIQTKYERIAVVFSRVVSYI